MVPKRKLAAALAGLNRNQRYNAPKAGMLIKKSKNERRPLCFVFLPQNKDKSGEKSFS